jgi:hypothetical protein
MMQQNHSATLSALAISLLLVSCSNSSAPTEGAATANETPTGRVFIASPADGTTVSSPVTVVFGLDNFLLAPAGTFEPGTGHHHLLIDVELPPLNQPIPSDANHLHFGKAQSEASIELEPGSHTLQLLLGDGAHVPHNDGLMSDVITVTVE